MTYVKTVFSRGITFLREHPQLWFTALVAVVILSSYLYFAWRFASIAQNAQEDLVNVRAGSFLDTFVVFVPDTINDRELLRTHVSQLREENPTIDSLVIYAEHGNGDLRVYLSDNGPNEGTVIQDVPDLYSLAYSTDSSYTMKTQRDGERYFITARAIHDQNGSPIALAVMEQSMAEADKQITENIQMSMYLLLGVLFVIVVLFLRHARIVDFATLYKKQVEIDKMKDSFVSMASHELKSPLSVIRGYVELLEDGAKDEEEHAEYLRRISISANELRDLIDDILDVSRIEMGRLRFSAEPVKTADILREVTDMFAVQAEGKGLELSLTIEEGAEDAVASVDRGRLKQVAVNLFSNALKYTLEGKVAVTQKVLDGKIIEFSVKDSGIGMTADELKKLFDKFYRAEAKEARAVKGTGLGLWITKYIIEHMKGTISVESIKGEGSRFVVQFPVSKEIQVQ